MLIIIIIIIIIGLKSVSASCDVIGDLSSPLGKHEMKFRKPWQGGTKVGVKRRVGDSIYQSGEKSTIYGGKRCVFRPVRNNGRD